jgi:hypothetical protein
MRLFTDYDIGKMQCFIHLKEAIENEENEEIYECCGKKKESKGCYKADHSRSDKESKNMILYPYSILFEEDIDLQWFLKENIESKYQVITRFNTEKELNTKYNFYMPNDRILSIDLKSEYTKLKEKINSNLIIPDIKDKTAYILYHTYDNQEDQDSLKITHEFIPFYLIRRMAFIKYK